MDVEDKKTEMEAAGCESIGGAPTTLWVKGQIEIQRNTIYMYRLLTDRDSHKHYIYV